jgi:beta-phosphoglucomutase-like phosphatase (HAD superfamily)
MRNLPPPDLFPHVADRMGAHPSECIVVEDSAAGVAAATDAGMTSIGFLGGSHTSPGFGSNLTRADARCDCRHARAQEYGRRATRLVAGLQVLGRGRGGCLG